jgi:hypothetical protein
MGGITVSRHTLSTRSHNLKLQAIWFGKFFPPSHLLFYNPKNFLFLFLMGITSQNQEFGFLFLNYPLLISLLHLFQKSFFFRKK